MIENPSHHTIKYTAIYKRTNKSFGSTNKQNNSHSITLPIFQTLRYHARATPNILIINLYGAVLCSHLKNLSRATTSILTSTHNKSFKRAKTRYSTTEYGMQKIMENRIHIRSVLARIVPTNIVKQSNQAERTIISSKKEKITLWGC